MNTPLTTVVLAAGKGTRMKSDKAKVLHEVFNRPMVHYVIDALLALEPNQTIAVVGHQEEEVRNSLKRFPLDYAVQEQQLGTGHAVLAAEAVCSAEDGVVMIVCGDTPLILPETLKAMYQQHLESGSSLTLMTTLLENPTNYGRIITGDDGSIKKIVEEKDADAEQKKIREVNAGIYCVNLPFLFETLKQVGTDNAQGEVYLTDIVSIAVNKGMEAKSFVHPEPSHVLGVNSRVELAQAHQELVMRRNKELMMQGVTMQLPQTISISAQSEIGRDTLLKQGVEVRGSSVIGQDCIIENGAVIIDSSLDDGVQVGAGAYIKNQKLERGKYVAPHACLMS